MTTGWLGSIDALMHYLGDAGADCDHNGSFKIYGSVTFGLGGEEVLVPGDTEYSVDDERHNLVAGLRENAGGITVGVF